MAKDSAKKPTKAAAKKTEKAAPAEATATGLPMFYQSVTPLNSANNGDLQMIPAKNAAFAATANSIVLAAAELPQAAMDYPIVFSKFGENVAAFAVTGYNSGENTYVDEDGKWRDGCYIPAYVRRYPFILIEDSENDTLSLAADLTSDMLGTEAGTAIYADGKPTEAATSAMNFCLAYHNELKKSDAIFKQIDEAGVLIERSADVTTKDGDKARIGGFMIVDENKLSELDDETFLSLRKSGALNLIYCQLWSMRVWNNLLG